MTSFEPAHRDIRHVDKTGCHAAGRRAAGRGVHIQVPTEVLPRVVVDRVKWFAPDQDLGYGVKFSSKIHCMLKLLPLAVLL